MPNIEDVSPSLSNMTFQTGQQYVTGRMLSLACSDDGQFVVAGSLSSNVCSSEDGGVSWNQVAWPQPPEGQFGVPGAMGGFCVTSVAVSPDSGRWLVDRAPRLMVDLTGNGRSDIVGFGETGVWTAMKPALSRRTAPKIF
jgi:hypothetical protein